MTILMTSTESNSPRPRRSHIFPREANEHYVEPAWCSQRLFEVEKFRGAIIDPACGWGTIVFDHTHTGSPQMKWMHRDAKSTT